MRSKLFITLGVVITYAIFLNVVPARAATRIFLPSVAKASTAHSIRVPVLLYHYVRPMPINDRLGVGLTVTPEAFSQQLAYLLAQGYTPISSTQLCGALTSSVKLPTKPIVLTFDDGTKDFDTTVYPILQTYGVPATVFMIAGFIGNERYLSWDELHTLGQSPLVTIGAHGLNHVSLTTLEAGIAQRQLTLSRNMLKLASGQAVDTFAYPNGATSSAIEKMAERSGYECAFSTILGAHQATGKRFELQRVRAGSSVQSLAQALTK